MVVGMVLRTAHQFGNFLFPQGHAEEPVFSAVACEDVRERRRDHNPKAEVSERPHGMFARGAAAKILARHQDARPPVAGMVEHKGLARLPLRRVSPVEKQKLPKSAALDSFQKLLGNDLVGIDVHPIERRHASGVYAKWFHRYFHTTDYWNFQVRISVKCPTIAAAAAIIGLNR